MHAFVRSLMLVAALGIQGGVLSGCATASTKVVARDGARVGLVIRVEDKARHVRSGLTVFEQAQNFSPVPWDIGVDVAREVKAALPSRFQVVDAADAPALVEDERSSFALSPMDRYTMGAKYRQTAADYARARNLDYIIVVQDVEDVVAAISSDLLADGSGLYTWCAMWRCNAAAYSHVEIFIVQASTGEQLNGVSELDRRGKLLLMEMADGAKEDAIPPQMFVEAKALILANFRERLLDALQRTGLDR